MYNFPDDIHPSTDHDGSGIGEQFESCSRTVDEPALMRRRLTQSPAECLVCGKHGDGNSSEAECKQCVVAREKRLAGFVRGVGRGSSLRTETARHESNGECDARQSI